MIWTNYLALPPLPLLLPVNYVLNLKSLQVARIPFKTKRKSTKPNLKIKQYCNFVHTLIYLIRYNYCRLSDAKDFAPSLSLLISLVSIFPRIPLRLFNVCANAKFSVAFCLGPNFTTIYSYEATSKSLRNLSTKYKQTHKYKFISAEIWCWQRCRQWKRKCHGLVIF